MNGYGQFCAVARALELLGERWTLLIVRELLLGASSFTDIRRGLPRIPRATLGVAELSAILLGGVSPVTLARAGRIETDDAHRLARVFASTTTPRLSFWY